MTCASSTTLSLGAWSPPCRMCGQLLLLIPDRAPPTSKTDDGTICFECYPEYVQQKLAQLKRWDAQYNALLVASAAGLPKSSIARITEILLKAET